MPGAYGKPNRQFQYRAVLVLHAGSPNRTLSGIIRFCDGLPAVLRDEASDFYKRPIYHPHGLVTGRCIMTSSDYQELNGGLALQLAVHASFGNNLIIAGLSLEDEYLRDQISK